MPKQSLKASTHVLCTIVQCTLHFYKTKNYNTVLCLGHNTRFSFYMSLKQTSLETPVSYYTLLVHFLIELARIRFQTC